MPNYSAIRAGHALKGPQDRLEELYRLRKEVEQKKPSEGYDPAMQLKSIDHEIARLSRPPKR